MGPNLGQVTLLLGGPVLDICPVPNSIRPRFKPLSLSIPFFENGLRKILNKDTILSLQVSLDICSAPRRDDYRHRRQSPGREFKWPSGYATAVDYFERAGYLTRTDSLQCLANDLRRRHASRRQGAGGPDYFTIPATN
jgi:hypothetical protein